MRDIQQAPDQPLSLLNVQDERRLIRGVPDFFRFGISRFKKRLVTVRTDTNAPVRSRYGRHVRFPQRNGPCDRRRGEFPCCVLEVDHIIPRVRWKAGRHQAAAVAMRPQQPAGSHRPQEYPVASVRNLGIAAQRAGIA